MPIQKFRDVSEMERSLWHEPGDPALAGAIQSAWRFAEQTCPRRYPPGVHRHRCAGDARARREQWDAECFREYWSRQDARRGEPTAGR